MWYQILHTVFPSPLTAMYLDPSPRHYRKWSRSKERTFECCGWKRALRRCALSWTLDFILICNVKIESFSTVEDMLPPEEFTENYERLCTTMVSLLFQCYWSGKLMQILKGPEVSWRDSAHSFHQAGTRDQTQVIKHQAAKHTHTCWSPSPTWEVLVSIAGYS